MAKQNGDTTKIREVRKTEADEILDLRRWWMARMATTAAPLLEKMTLFWHGHFATSVEKVKDGYWMWLQTRLSAVTPSQTSPPSLKRCLGIRR